jgi:hypothetical protein
VFGLLLPLLLLLLLLLLQWRHIRWPDVHAELHCDAGTNPARWF